MLKAIKETDFSLTTAPLFIAAAELEKVVDADAAVYLFNAVPSKNKLIKVRFVRSPELRRC